ncbi:globin-like [Gigantopelta aegis]|uniref:globin-like n=1 Tax=Gigantopelta aegis TaxID=1735272 RepID=UPI001B887C22|nr:globin-like [Gigantopelta aegis]
MGITNSVIQTLGYGEADSNLDLATGMTRRQKNLVKKSWVLMRSHQKENGVALFVLLFTRYPHQQDYFQLFRCARLEDLEVSPAMRAHGTTVMATIGSFVDNLDDAECLVDLVQKMAKNHLGRGIPITSFEYLRSLFSYFLEERLGEQATPEIKESWDRFLLVMNSLVEMEAQRLAAMGECVYFSQT